MAFEPKILTFTCNWCSYAGADLAGVSRFQYPPNIRIIRLMCSGDVDPEYVLDAFLSGYDGVLVLGCHPGECHYLTGNYHAEKKMKRTKRLLEIANIGGERLRIDWVSAAEGMRFAQIVSSFTEEIKASGPLYEDSTLRHRLQAAKLTVQEEKVRWLLGKEIELLEGGNVFGEKLSPPEFETLIDETFKDEYFENRITVLLGERSLSVKELAAETGINSKDVLSYLVDLMGSGEVCFQSTEGKTPRYTIT